MKNVSSQDVSSAIKGLGLGMAIGITLSTLASDSDFSAIEQFQRILQNSLVCLSCVMACWLCNREKERSFEKKVAALYRFAEFGKLSSGVFHDLITPLTAISLTIEKLREEGNLPSSDVTEQIERAIRASKRMESFMHTARKQLTSEHHDCFFSIKQEVEEAAYLLQHKTRISDVKINIDIPEEYEIYGNPVRFFQMMVNLMSNAADSYTNINREEENYHTIFVSVRKKEKHIEISVKDEGCGIPHHAQPLIFDPFFTTKLGREGIGLGLSLTKQIVERSFRGKISVESTHGKGSVFTVTIPLRKPHNVPSAGIEPTSAR